METVSNEKEHTNSSKLFSPVQIGALNLSHRVVMAPLTRMRTVNNNIPNQLMVDYYTQRATDGGFIIAEATVVSVNGHGYYQAPGIYTDEQAAGWRAVTDAVHAKGGRIFLQLFHSGRQSHSDLQPDGGLPVGPSAITHDNHAITPSGYVPVTQNRALEIGEIHSIINDFRKAAERAKIAGFDGVELHGANGYLVDQFLQDGSNNRTDVYGGTIENRSRFLLEIVEGLVSVWGGSRVGVRLGPSNSFGGMHDSNPIALFSYAAEQLNRFGLAYLHIIEPRVKGSYIEVEGLQPVASAHMRHIFKGTIIAAGGFDREGAEDIIEKGDADLVAFGRSFIANPDLPLRLKLGLPLNDYDRNTFYGGDERGYTDYPFYNEHTFAKAVQEVQ